MPQTIHHRHLEAIVARLEGRAIPLEQTCAVWTDDSGETWRCNEPSAEVLYFMWDAHDDHHGVCARHLAEYVAEHPCPC